MFTGESECLIYLYTAPTTRDRPRSRSRKLKFGDRGRISEKKTNQSRRHANAHEFTAVINIVLREDVLAAVLSLFVRGFLLHLHVSDFIRKRK